MTTAETSHRVRRRWNAIWAFRSVVAFGVIATAVAGCGGSPNEQPRKFRVDPKCPTCRVRLVREVDLGTESDPDGPNDATIVTGFAGDHFLAIAAGGDALIEYDHEGRFLRAIGVKGDGPNELRNVFDLYSRAGLALAARRDERTIVIDSTGRLVSEVRVPARCQLLSLGAGALCVGYRWDSLGHGPVAFHLLDSAWAHRKSFGDRGIGNPAFCPFCRSQVSFEGAPITSFWAVEWPPYRLQHWTTGGKRLVSLTIGDSAPFNGYSVDASSLSPKGMANVSAVVPHAVDSLWVARSIDTSSAHLELYKSHEWTPGRVSLADIQATSITYLELVAAGSGVVARAVLTGKRLNALDKDRFWSFDQASSGEMRLVIWRAVLTGP